jgi:hypothetical protein
VERIFRGAAALLIIALNQAISYLLNRLPF